jgi:hypothetical protein
MRIASVFATVLLTSFAIVATSAQDKKADEPKIVLPKDPKAVVISYDPGAGGFVRKGEAPYLKIQADGSVTVTNLHTAAKKEAKLTAKELDDLVRFILVEQKFLDLSEKKMTDAITKAAGKGPFIAVGGAGASKILVEANDKKHEVSFRAASAYLGAYPKVELVPQFVAIEKRLGEFARMIEKGK